jgi:hypothetical protein
MLAAVLDLSRGDKGNQGLNGSMSMIAARFLGGHDSSKEALEFL